LRTTGFSSLFFSKLKPNNLFSRQLYMMFRVALRHLRQFAHPVGLGPHGQPDLAMTLVACAELLLEQEHVFLTPRTGVVAGMVKK
jgi:hypothetical protein